MRKLVPFLGRVEEQLSDGEPGEHSKRRWKKALIVYWLGQNCGRTRSREPCTKGPVKMYDFKPWEEKNELILTCHLLFDTFSTKRFFYLSCECPWSDTLLKIPFLCSKTLQCDFRHDNLEIESLRVFTRYLSLYRELRLCTLQQLILWHDWLDEWKSFLTLESRTTIVELELKKYTHYSYKPSSTDRKNGLLTTLDMKNTLHGKPDSGLTGTCSSSSFTWLPISFYINFVKGGVLRLSLLPLEM